MAGLLDIFGTSGADTMGLLGMSPEDIQRSRDDAQAQALYALAGRLFQGGNTGASIAQGLQAGQQTYKANMQSALQEQLQNAQLQEMLKKKQDEQLAKQLFMRGYKPAVAGVESMPVEEGGRYLGESPAVAAKTARFDIASVAPELIALGDVGQAKLKTALELQKAMSGETFKLGEGEKQYQRNPLTGEVTEVAAGAPKEKPLHYQDVGDAIVAYDSKGKEVFRQKKGRAPEGPVNFQTVETDQGLMAFNPRTMQMSPILGANGEPLTKGTKPTEAETNAAGFANRMIAANEITSKLATGNKPKFGEAALSVIPLIGDKIPEVIPKGIGGLSDERRQYLQAANNFIRANLRKESGAAIGVDEWKQEFINYFPQYNDDEQTIKNKEMFRNILTQNMKAAGGKSFKKITPESTSMTETYDLSPRLSNSLRGGQ